MRRLLRMTFERGCEEHIFDLINDRLRELNISELSIVRDNGYGLLLKTYDADGRLKQTEYDCGFDKIVFEYEEADAGDGLDWQIDRAAFDPDANMDCHALRSEWLEAHPDRVMRVLRHVDYTGVDVFVWLHHERVS